jgi:dTDP-4-amino-4,6-dideoxygalactose transaminase
MSNAPWRVPLADVRVGDDLLEAVREAVASGWWSMGPRVGAFEEAFADLCGSSFAFGVANGTAALHLALLAAGVGPGDEVILPSLNFVAAANVVGHVGATPVFCDIVDQDDLNLDPADLEAAVTPATRAVIVLHYAGFACDMDAVMEIADRHGLIVIEDAAHAPGGRWGVRACGSIGAIGCFSFFSNKNIPIGEGGMIVTSDPELADRLRLLRSHGMTTLTWDRHRGHAHTYDVLIPGFNYRIDELRAAMGLVQLGRLPEANAARRRIAARYRELLHDRAGIRLAFADGDVEASAHHLTVAVLPAGTERDAVRSLLTEQRIQTSVHYPPIHRFTAYAEAGRRRPLPQTEAVADRIVTLPLYPELRDDQIELVATALVEAIAAKPAMVG